MSQTTIMEWRPIEGFAAYEVSECGDVRRVVKAKTRPAGHRLKGFIDLDGYIRYFLTNNSGEKQAVLAHRIVAIAFIGPPPSSDHEAAHNNGSRVSCHWSHLRWATRKENDSDRVEHGTSPKGENNGRAKITEDDVRFIRSEYRAIRMSENKRSILELAQKFGLHRSTVFAIATGSHWSHVPMEHHQ